MYELNGVTKGISLSLNVFTWWAMRPSCGKISATTTVKTTLKFKENTYEGLTLPFISLDGLSFPNVFFLLLKDAHH